MGYTSNYQSFADSVSDMAVLWSDRQPIEETLIDQANKLSCSNFGPDNQGLFQHAQKLAPSKDALVALPIQLDWHIKREPGTPIFSTYKNFTPKRGRNAGKTRRVTDKPGEIETRIRHRFYQAAYWLSARLSKYAGGKNGDKAIVFIETSGAEMSVIIRNNASGADRVAARYGYIEDALMQRQADIDRYIAAHVEGLKEKWDAATLNAPR